MKGHVIKAPLGQFHFCLAKSGGLFKIRPVCLKFRKLGKPISKFYGFRVQTLPLQLVECISVCKLSAIFFSFHCHPFL